MAATQDILLKLILSLVIGGALGAEREYRSKSAGFRTITLICLGATIFTIFSQIIGGSSNPDRIASNIVTGIGFVGAGVIFKGDSTSKVNGITTAAMIWVTAALGVAIGAGYLLIAGITTLMILVVLFAFSLVEERIDSFNQLRNYRIVCPFENETLHRYETLFKSHHLRFKRTRQGKSAENLLTGEWLVQGSEKNHRHVIHELMRDPTVRELEF
ncbi:MgtC/SapB family protein [Puia dinghuensis]|uniref:Magnesium transporter MgtC n=1 Tax=Puia dinghuensis TaxID=1792502 RepID=A0A8J2XQT8_9BACT|nr:MgtC/SapB family protein [Puia dinghuensis]GGA86402.1 magnesium transporter MgtC [Puia dinghuensis]